AFVDRQGEVPAAFDAPGPERNAPILRPAFRAPDLLARERLQVSDEIRKEMVDHDSGDDVVRVDRPDSEGQLELLVDLLRHRTFSIGRGERAVHEASALVGQERSREIDQAVEQQDDGILVAVAVPPSGGDEIRMSEAGIRIRESDDSSEYAAARVRRERHDEMAKEIPRRLGLVEAREAVQSLEQVVDEGRHADQVLPTGPGQEDVLRP